MKKCISSVLVSSLTVIFVGCGSTQQSVAPKIVQTKNIAINSNLPVDYHQKDEELPKWILNPNNKEGYIGEVGISPARQNSNIRVMSVRALADGKEKLASRIREIFSAKTDELIDESHLNNNGNSREIYRSAFKTIVKSIPLTDAHQINRYRAKDGTLYLHIVINLNNIKKSLKRKQELLKAKLRQEQHEISEQDLEKNVEILLKATDELH